MKNFTPLLLLLLLAGSRSWAQCQLDKSNYQLIFEDNFDTYNTVADLDANWQRYPNPADWAGGWGNEYYHPDQVSLQPGGIVRLTATRVSPFQDPLNKNDPFDPNIKRMVYFRSGKLESKVYPDPGTWQGNPGGFTYGMFEIRCKLPDDDNGTWPAFWLYSGPTEIDVIEYQS